MPNTPIPLDALAALVWHLEAKYQVHGALPLQRTVRQQVVDATRQASIDTLVAWLEQGLATRSDED